METEKRFIPILSDYGFKITFANEKNTLFLRRAIQALIQSPVAIESVELSRNEFAGATKDSRGGLYDLVCVDENQTTFIVEMQLGDYKQFVQRSKFYAFQKFNTLVMKGKYQFEGIPRIYCIGFLAKDLFPYQDYYHFCQLKNQHGEKIDEQMFHILVEIRKFTKEKHEIVTDLDKLIYTMKHIHEVAEPIEFPEFWTEEWIEIAIQQLDTHNFTPEERMAYEMTLAHNASVIKMIDNQIKEAAEKMTKEAVKEVAKEVEARVRREEQEKLKTETDKIKKEEQAKLKEETDKIKKEEQAKLKAEQEKTIATIKKLLMLGLFPVEQIAEITNSTLEQVLVVQKEIEG
jgi:predicted transposase/invertase (TIGR01784 family)